MTTADKIQKIQEAIDQIEEGIKHNEETFGGGTNMRDLIDPELGHGVMISVNMGETCLELLRKEKGNLEQKSKRQ